MCNLGTSSVKSEELRRRRFDCLAILEGVGFENRKREESCPKAPFPDIDIDGVLIGDDAFAILRPSESYEHEAQKLKTGSTFHGVNQRSSLSKYSCVNGASIMALRGLLRF